MRQDGRSDDLKWRLGILEYEASPLYVLTDVSRQHIYVFILGELLKAHSKDVRNFVAEVGCFVVK